MHFRQWLLLCMLFVYAPLTPALDKPDCTLIEKWATAGDAQETTQISPGLQLSVLAEDDRMVPLFGKSIYSWDRDDFRDFNTTVNVCAKAASKRRDRATRDTLQQAMRSVRKAQGPVSELTRAREAGSTAVTALLEEPASPETIVMLERAEEALQGKEVRPQLRGMPRALQQQIASLIRAQRYLATTDVEALALRLAERRSALVAEREEAEAAATAELEAARRELESLANDAQGLAVLDRMSKLPALETARPEQARAFLDSVAQKRRSIEDAQRQAREEESSRIASTMVERINAFEVKQPADLGKLWNLGKEMGEELRGSGARSGAQMMNAAFWKRFNAAATAMLQPFEKQLEAIPVSQEALKPLSRAVPELTGIERDMPVMRPYHQAVRARGEQIAGELRRIACEKTLDAAGVSGSEAKQALWGAGAATTLGEFLCTIATRGSEVHEYDDAGLLSDTHTLKLTTNAEGFHTLKLHKGEVKPGEKMLIGFEVADANQKRALSVSDWESYVAVNLRGDKAAAGGSDSAECDRLANKPRGELSLVESQRLMGCILSTIPAMIQNR